MFISLFPKKHAEPSPHVLLDTADELEVVEYKLG